VPVRQAAVYALEVAIHPGRAFERIASAASVRAAMTAVIGSGVLWAGLCLLLWRGGHAPSRALIPVPANGYYLAQALWVVPALLVCWAALGVSAHGLSRLAGGGGARTSMLACAGFAYAVPLAGLFVIPDLVAYSLFGFASLGKLVRITGLLLALAEWALMTRAVMAVHGLGWARAVPVALAALVVQALVGAPFLR
jgi:hypothetical protein